MAAGGGEVSESEVTLKRAHGVPVSVSTNSHYHRDAAGALGCFQGVLSDVTQAEARAAEALAESEPLSRLLLQSAGHGHLFGVDRERDVQFMNAAAEEMLGWTGAELQDLGDEGRHPLRARRRQPVPDPRVPAACGVHRGRGEPRRRRVALAQRDGTSFPAKTRACPTAPDDGQVTGGVITFLVT